MPSFARYVLPVVGLALLGLAWHVYVVAFHVPMAVLPRPSAVGDAIVANWRLLLAEGQVTLLESLYGFLLAFALGVPLAIMIVASRTLNLMFYPLLIATQSVPKVALAPLILVWLGVGLQSKLAIAWLVAFFPIVVDTATGLRNTPAEFMDLATSVRASGWQTFWKIRFPAALPFVLAGCKVAITLAVIGAVIGEFIGSNEGLGNLLLVANSQVNEPLAFAALFALAALGIGLYAAVVGGRARAVALVRRGRPRLSDPNVRSGCLRLAAAFAHHDADEVGGVARADLLHQVGAMHLDGARADAELAAGLLVGGAVDDLAEDVLLAPAQRLAPGKIEPLGLARVFAGLLQRARLDRGFDPRDHVAAAEWFFDEVQRAVPDRVDRHCDVAVARHDEDRHRVILRVELLEDVEAGFAGDVHVENDAHRRARVRGGNQRGAIRKAGDAVAGARK